MLMPKRVKRRRVFRGRMKGTAHRGNFIAYGEYGLVALEPCWVTSQQILPNTGWPWLRPAACCSRSLACPRLMLVKRCAWPATSCPCAASSLPVKATERMVSNE